MDGGGRFSESLSGGDAAGRGLPARLVGAALDRLTGGVPSRSLSVRRSRKGQQRLPRRFNPL